MGAAGFGLAYTVTHINSGTASVTPTPTAATVATTTRTKNKKGNKKYTGVIEMLGANSFVLSSGKKSKTITVMVNDQTVYNGPEGKISFSSLMIGEMVQVKGTVNSQTQAYTATDVTVTSSGNTTPTP